MEEEVGGNARIIGLCVQVAFLCKGIRNCDYIMISIVRKTVELVLFSLLANWSKKAILMVGSMIVGIECDWNNFKKWEYICTPVDFY